MLNGQITRGDIEEMKAAIFVSDIRGWTALNNRVSSKAAVALANRYFEIVGQSIEENGGEILKLIGDGVLAVFPYSAEDPKPEVVCTKALFAARQAFELARTAQPQLGLSFGVGLHFGEVLYGNIGSETRIDFTVLGKAVNIAARIEGLCGKLGEPILFSQEIADHLSESVSLAARETLKGNDAPSAVYRPRSGL